MNLLLERQGEPHVTQYQDERFMMVKPLGSRSWCKAS